MTLRHSVAGYSCLRYGEAAEAVLACNPIPASAEMLRRHGAQLTAHL